MGLLTESTSVSEDWFVSEGDERPASLIVRVARRACVLPWFRFVYAEGDDDSVLIVFVSHRIQVKGRGLAALLAALSTHRVVRIARSSQNEAKFKVGPCIEEIVLVEEEKEQN